MLYQPGFAYSPGIRRGGSLCPPEKSCLQVPAPKVRCYTSLGHRPRYIMATGQIRAEGPPHKELRAAREGKSPAVPIP